MRAVLQAGAFFPRVGGMETRMFNLAKTLSDLGHEVTVVAPEPPDPDREGRWPGFDVRRHARFVQKPHVLGAYWRVLWQPRRRHRYWQVAIDAFPPRPWDFVYAAVRDVVWRLKRQAPETIVLFAPGGTSFGARRETYPGAGRRLSLWGFRERLNYRQDVRFERRAARIADAVLPQTDLVGRVFREQHRVDPERVKVLPNGADLERFRPRDDRAGFRRRLGLGGDGFLTAFVGRLGREKNVGYLLEALAAPAAAAARAVIVGTGDEEPRLKALADRLGVTPRVTFAGQRQNVEDYLTAANLFVLPSTSESFGNALVEAMAAGLPVACLRPDFGRINTGVAEHVEDGVTGFLLDPDDPGDLAGRIALLANDEARARSMGRAARQAAERKFNWTAIAGRLVTIVEELRRRGQD